MSTATRQKPNALRAENARLRAELAKYVGHEPTIAEEMAYLASENERLDGAVQALAEQLATVSEHAFGVGWTAARILAKRHDYSDRWAIVDGTLMAARYWGRDYTWHSTAGASLAEMFPWSDQEARHYAKMLASDTADQGREELPADLSPQDQALVDTYLGEVAEALGDIVVADVEKRLAEAKHGRHAGAAEKVISVPAAVDVPGYRPEPPDPADAETILTPLAASISANTEQETVALPQARVHGPEDTALLPIVHVEAIPPTTAPAPMPPLPERPPLFMPLPPVTWRGGQLRPLSESHPVQFVKTGART